MLRCVCVPPRERQAGRAEDGGRSGAAPPCVTMVRRLPKDGLGSPEGTFAERSSRSLRLLVPGGWGAVWRTLVRVQKPNNHRTDSSASRVKPKAFCGHRMVPKLLSTAGMEEDLGHPLARFRRIRGCPRGEDQACGHGRRDGKCDIGWVPQVRGVPRVPGVFHSGHRRIVGWVLARPGGQHRSGLHGVSCISGLLQGPRWLSSGWATWK